MNLRARWVHDKGELKIGIIHAGVQMSDGGLVFGVVPRVMWEKVVKPDENNRVPCYLNLMIIAEKDKIILVDTGYGEKLSEKIRERISFSCPASLDSSLKELGLSVNDIDTVVLTHLHADHAGGATAYRDGRPVPAFPRARYLVQKLEFQDAMKPNERTKATYLRENYEPLFNSGRLELLEGEYRISENIILFPTGGHTRAHQALQVKLGNTVLIHPGDLIPNSYCVNPAWISAADTFPLDSLERKKELLERAAGSDMVFFFNHDPSIFFSKIIKVQDKFKPEPLDTF